MYSQRQQRPAPHAVHVHQHLQPAARAPRGSSAPIAQQHGMVPSSSVPRKNKITLTMDPKTNHFRSRFDYNLLPYVSSLYGVSQFQRVPAANRTSCPLVDLRR